MDMGAGSRDGKKIEIIFILEVGLERDIIGGSCSFL